MRVAGQMAGFVRVTADWMAVFQLADWTRPKVGDWVAVPMGYKMVMSCTLGMHGIYCTQPSGHFAPLYFGAINAIRP